MPKAAKNKYDHLVRSIPIKDYHEGGFRQGVELDKKWLGFDVHIKYGCYWTAGRMGKAPYTPHAHDFDQVLLFAGSDMDDIGDLGAEVEFCLGDELETHMITTTTAVAIPAGMPHFPATVNFLNKRFFYYEISMTPGYKEKPVLKGKNPAPSPGGARPPGNT